MHPVHVMLANEAFKLALSAGDQPRRLSDRSRGRDVWDPSNIDGADHSDAKMTSSEYSQLPPNLVHNCPPDFQRMVTVMCSVEPGEQTLSIKTRSHLRQPSMFRAGADSGRCSMGVGNRTDRSSSHTPDGRPLGNTWYSNFNIQAWRCSSPTLISRHRCPQSIAFTAESAWNTLNWCKFYLIPDSGFEMHNDHARHPASSQALRGTLPLYSEANPFFVFDDGLHWRAVAMSKLDGSLPCKLVWLCPVDKQALFVFLRK